MSKISQIYDAIEAHLVTALPGYRKIPNPYVAEDNAELFLTKGYGISIGSGINSERQIGGKKSYLRTFVVPIVNLVTTTDNNSTQREALEKSIIEDHFQILSRFEADPTLGGTTAKAAQLNDSGVLFLEGDRNKYLLIEIGIDTEYFEDI